VNSTSYAYLFLGAAIVTEVVGSSFLQKSAQFTKLGPTVISLVCFVGALFFLSQALREIPLGVAYAIWAGLGVVLTAIVGLVIFRQSLDIAAIAGIGLIVSGVVVMQLLSKSTGH
jgi:small multidrug resistance pump